MRGIAAIGAHCRAARIDERHPQLRHHAGMKAIKALNLFIKSRIAHHRQAHPHHRCPLRAQGFDIAGNARRHFALPSGRQQGCHPPIDKKALHIIGAIADHRDIHRALCKLAGKLVLQIGLAVARETSGLLGIAQHLKGFAARQLIVECRPQAIAKTVAKHPDAKRPASRHRARQAGRHAPGIGNAGWQCRATRRSAGCGGC